MSSPNQMTEAEEWRLDWALFEIEGRHTPPDLTEEILRRMMTGDRSKPEHEPVRRRPVWHMLAVAAGLIAVVSIALLTEWRPEVVKPGTQRDQDPHKQNKTSLRKRKLPPPFLVKSLDDVRRLPRDARNVCGIGIGDAELKALAEIRGLERLDLTRVGQTKTLTDDGLRHLAGLSKLRELVLDHQRGITGTGVAGLADLPILESLSLRGVSTSKGALATLAKKLSALRKLDLGFSSSVTDDILGVVAKMSGLKWLSLRGCSRLTSKGLAKLQSLDQLEHLDIGKLDSNRGLIGDRAIFVPTAGRPKAIYRFKGAVDELIVHLPSSLRSLGLVDSWSLTDKGLALIATRCPQLTDIDISGCIKLTDAGLAKLLADLEIRSLDISLTRFSDRVLDNLLAEKTLEELQASLRWVTGDVATQLKALPRMRRLETDSSRPPDSSNPLEEPRTSEPARKWRK